MPLPNMPDGLHTSISQMKCFLRCPRQYELKYKLGIQPAFVPLAFAFGGYLGLGLTGVWMSMALDECLRGVVSYRRWRTGRWRTTSILAPAAQIELAG